MMIMMIMMGMGMVLMMITMRMMTPIAAVSDLSPLPCDARHFESLHVCKHQLSTLISTT